MTTKMGNPPTSYPATFRIDVTLTSSGCGEPQEWRVMQPIHVNDAAEYRGVRNVLAPVYFGMLRGISDVTKNIAMKFVEMSANAFHKGSSAETSAQAAADLSVLIPHLMFSKIYNLKLGRPGYTLNVQFEGQWDSTTTIDSDLRDAEKADSTCSYMSVCCGCCIQTPLMDTMRCSECKAFYCSRECQVKHWPKHKVVCGHDDVSDPSWGEMISPDVFELIHSLAL